MNTRFKRYFLKKVFAGQTRELYHYARRYLEAKTKMKNQTSLIYGLKPGWNICRPDIKTWLHQRLILECICFVIRLCALLERSAFTGRRGWGWGSIHWFLGGVGSWRWTDGGKRGIRMRGKESTADCTTSCAARANCPVPQSHTWEERRSLVSFRNIPLRLIAIPFLLLLSPRVCVCVCAYSVARC